MTIKANYPAIRPSLLLDFANSRVLDPRITFARASTALYTDKDGMLKVAEANTPRFDFDPITGVCKGLLIEEARTNLFLYSEQLDHASWNAIGLIVTPNAIAAPDGSITADKLSEAAASRYVYRGTAVTSGVAYAASYFVKAAERTQCRIQFYSTNRAFANQVVTFDLSAGTASGDIPAYGMKPLENGWWRVWAASTALATVTGNVSIGIAGTYTGDAVSGIYVWGAQLEAGSFPTSYISTTSAQVTRAADIPSMTGANFSSWYRQDEGTFVAETDTTAVTATDKRLFSVNNGTASSAMSLHYGAAAGGIYSSAIQIDGVYQFGPNEGAYSANTLTKRAFAYKAGDLRISTNGVLSATSSPSALVPIVNRLDIGNRVNLQQINGHVASLSYFPARLSNSELQALSA